MSLLLSLLLLPLASAQWWLFPWLPVAPIRFGTQNCIHDCFLAEPTWFFCTASRSLGYCCPDQTKIECVENATLNTYCSLGAANQTVARYSYCPRRTEPCVTPGPTLTPMLNMPQSVAAVKSMNGSAGDVCTWEMKFNGPWFQQNHPGVSLSDVFVELQVM